MEITIIVYMILAVVCFSLFFKGDLSLLFPEKTLYISRIYNVERLCISKYVLKRMNLGVI